MCGGVIIITCGGVTIITCSTRMIDFLTLCGLEWLFYRRIYLALDLCKAAQVVL